MVRTTHHPAALALTPPTHNAAVRRLGRKSSRELRRAAFRAQDPAVREHLAALAHTAMMRGGDAEIELVFVPEDEAPSDAVSIEQGHEIARAISD